MASKSKLAGKGRTSGGGGVGGGGRAERRSGKVRDSRLKEEERETLAFKVLSNKQTKELTELDTIQNVQSQLAQIMKLTENDVDLKEAAMLDYYTSGFWWGRGQNYTTEQLSAFFTVLHTLLQNIKEKHMNVVENLKEFKKMLAGIGVDIVKLNGGLDCFEINQAKSITDYLYTSLFQHYKLYEFMFSHTQAEEIIGTDLLVEVAPPADMPWPPPLAEGVSEEIYTAHIAPPPPSATAQDGTEEGQATESGDRAAYQDDVISEEQAQKEADLLSQLTPDEIKSVVHGVFEEMMGGLQTDVAKKLREKENSFINQLNKIHRVAEKP